MSLFDSLKSMAESGLAESGNPNAKVAGGLMAALDEHPGGLQGVIDTMQQNGVNTQDVATGQPTSPSQINQGLAGSGLIDRVAEKAGVSPQVAEMAMATILPMVIAHFTRGGQQAPPQGGFGSMAGEILGKLL